MNEKRILNVFLAIVAGLLLVNLGCMLSPGTRAVSNIQYKTVQVMNGPNQVARYQEALDQMSAQGVGIC